MGGGAAAGGDFEAVLAEKSKVGWRGLFKTGKIIAITCFASLGGVLYGYNQVGPSAYDPLTYRESSPKSRS